MKWALIDSRNNFDATSDISGENSVFTTQEDAKRWVKQTVLRELNSLRIQKGEEV